MLSGFISKAPIDQFSFHPVGGRESLRPPCLLLSGNFNLTRIVT